MLIAIGCLIIALTGTIELLILCYSSFRNNWVCAERIKLIHSDYEKYKRLPEYKEMVFGHGFWIWNIEYFLKERK